MALSDLLVNLAEGVENVELRGLVQARVALLLSISGIVGAGVIEEMIATKTLNPLAGAGEFTNAILGLVERTEQPIGRAIFQGLLARPMGVEFSEVSGQAANAVTTIEKVFGFATELSLGTGAIAGALEPLLGTHSLKGLLQSIREIPQEIGLPFFLGTVGAQLFETAVGTPIREEVGLQTRPTRLDIRLIARLLKQKAIDAQEATTYLQRAGLRDVDIPRVLALERTLLTLSDLTTLHETAYWSDTKIQLYLDSLGLTTDDQDAQMFLFRHKAQTEGAGPLKAIARKDFLEGHVSETDYRAILDGLHVPFESADLLVESAIMERDASRLKLTVAEIKDLMQHQHIDNHQAVAKLQEIGASEQTASDLMIVWQDEQKVKRVGLGTARILAYYKGGVLTAEQTFKRLVDEGMRTEDAQFLVDHPESQPGIKTHPLAPATIYAALTDGVITADESRALLKGLSVAPGEVDLRIQTVAARQSRGKKPKQALKNLSEATILEALKLGLATDTWAIRELEAVGFAVPDAMLMVAVELTKLDAGWPKANGWEPLT